MFYCTALIVTLILAKVQPPLLSLKISCSLYIYYFSLRDILCLLCSNATQVFSLWLISPLKNVWLCVPHDGYST